LFGAKILLNNEMRQMKYQKGFTLLEGLLIILILSVVGFAGYTVWNNQQDDQTKVTDNNQQEATNENKPDTFETTESDNTQGSTKGEIESFSSYGITLSLLVPEGWTSNAINGYDQEYEYLIDITNEEKDIELSLQITKYEYTTKYEQEILSSFTGFNGNKYFLTNSLDDGSSEDKYYGQIGLTTCDDGHCVTPINEMYNLNANITPVGTKTEFNGSEANLNDIIDIFKSIEIK
jgi:type II secretory pathway pseudopilin PulG